MKRHSRRSATKSKAPTTTVVPLPPKKEETQPECNYGLWLRHSISSIVTSGYMFHGVRNTVAPGKVPPSNQDHA